MAEKLGSMFMPGPVAPNPYEVVAAPQMLQTVVPVPVAAAPTPVPVAQAPAPSVAQPTLMDRVGQGVKQLFTTPQGAGAFGQMAQAFAEPDSPAAKIGNIFVEQARLQNLLKMTKSELNKAMMGVAPDVAAASGSGGGGTTSGGGGGQNQNFR